MLDGETPRPTPRIFARRAGGEDDLNDAEGTGEAFFDLPAGSEPPSRIRRDRRRDRRRGQGAVEPAGPTVTVKPSPKKAVPSDPRMAVAPSPKSAVPRAVVLRLRRRRRRVIIGVTAFSAICVLLAGSGTLYLRKRLADIPRVALPNLVQDEPGEVMNVLLVGSDSREGLEGEAAEQAGKGQVFGQRSDTIMVLHVDPRQRQAAILSIPRDLYLPVVGGAGSDRINAAFSAGGPDQLIATIRQGLGITINHYIQVDFVGFQHIVDTVGGVKIYVPTAVRDFTSGLDIPTAGCVELDGKSGLAWVRSRNLETLVDGRWITDPRADLGRIQRQQDFIRRILKKALSAGLTNPLRLNRLIDIGVDDVTLDDDLSTRDITTLARRFDNLDADSVALLTLPTTPATIGGASVLELQTGPAQPLIDRINGLSAGEASAEVDTTIPTTLPTTLVGPADVKVRVLNGTDVKGAAARAGQDVSGAGFVVTGVGDSPPVTKTTIRYAPQRRVRAELVERSLLGSAILVEDPSVGTANDVVLVVGTDFLGARIGALPPVPEPVDVSTGGTTPTTLALPTTTTTTPPPITPILTPGESTTPTC